MNKSALVAVPVLALVVAVVLNRDRINAPDWVLIAGFVVLAIAIVAVAFRFPGRALAAFEMAAQTMLDSVGTLVGFQDINFDDRPDFSKRFLLRGDSEREVRALFTPGVLHAFERLDESFDLTVEGAGDCVAVYKPNREVSPDRIQSFALQAASVAAALRG